MIRTATFPHLSWVVAKRFGTDDDKKTRWGVTGYILPFPHCCYSFHNKRDSVSQSLVFRVPVLHCVNTPCHWATHTSWAALDEELRRWQRCKDMRGCHNHTTRPTIPLGNWTLWQHWLSATLYFRCPSLGIKAVSQPYEDWRTWGKAS